MKLKHLFLCLLLLAVCASATEKWGAFSDPFPIRDVAIFGDDAIVLATDGGVRYRSLTDDYVYHSEEGLETSRFYAVASSPDQGIFAISEYGLVASLGGTNKPWHVLNRSYVKNNVRVVPRGATIAGTVMTIAFEDRLAFFDLTLNRSILTIDRIGSKSLLTTPIREILVRGDSLYVRMDNATFVRKMDWVNLPADKRLSDPNTWTLVPADVSVVGFDELVAQVIVDSQVLMDPALYHDDGASKVKWQVKTKNGTYLVGSEYIFFCENGTYKVTDLTKTFGYLPGEVYELKTSPYGGVFAASVDGMLSYGDINSWQEPQYVFGVIGNGANAYSARIKALSFLPDGHLFYHIWGFVYLMYSDWGKALEFFYKSTGGYCFENYMQDIAISVATIPAPDGSGFLTSTGSNNGYGVIYFTTDGEVHCANRVGENPIPGVMYSRIDGNDWLVYVASKKGTALASEGGLDVIRFPSPKSNGGELANGTLKTYRGISPAPVDMVYDSVGERLWLVSMSNLAYLDEESDTLLTPSSTNGLRGVEYTSIDVDVHGNLWVGTTNQGVFRLTPKKGSPDTLTVKQFTTKDGLLDNYVTDVSIDPVFGVAWFAHEKGVSYYRRNDLKDARDNMTDLAKADVRAYPVPFRPGIHALLTIDGIAENSTVSIYNRGGALVKSFRDQDVLGGKIEWDGREKTGKFVAPGVYYYVVKNGSTVKKGKFIIIH